MTIQTIVAKTGVDEQATATVVTTRRFSNSDDVPGPVTPETNGRSLL